MCECGRPRFRVWTCGAEAVPFVMHMPFGLRRSFYHVHGSYLHHPYGLHIRYHGLVHFFLKD